MMRLWLLLCCFTVLGCSQSQLRYDDPRASSADLNLMMKTFYRNPQPNLFLTYIDNLNQQVKDPNVRFLVIPFAGEIFKKYPTEAIIWSHRIIGWQLRAPTETIFWQALKYSDLKVYEEVKSKSLKGAANRRLHAIKLADAMNKKDYLITATAKSGQELDSLWGRFFATGNKFTLQKIVSTLEITPKTTEEQKLVAKAAALSIGANVKGDPNLLTLLKAEAKGKYSKQIKDDLNVILIESETTH